MKSINISEVRNKLPALVDEVATTMRPVTMLRYGKPVAVVIPFKANMSKQDKTYPLRGTPISMAEDFNASTDCLWEACQEAECKRFALPTCVAKTHQKKG